MTTSARRIPRPASRWGNRLRNFWRILFTPGDMTTLFIAFGLLLTPALALSETGWPIDLTTVIPAFSVSIVLGFLLSRSRYGEFATLVMSSIYGLGFTLLITAMNQPGDVGEGVFSVYTRVVDWLTAATGGGVNQDDLIFTLLAAFLFWLLGYSVTWHIFRVDRLWRALVPPGLIIVVNNVYYTGNANVDIYLFAYLLMALIVAARSHVEAREWSWYSNGIMVPRRIRQQFLRMSAALALFALLVAWQIPAGDLQDRLDRFQAFLQADPLSEIAEAWGRLFTTADVRGPTTADYYGADSLQLGGAIQLGEQVVMVVSAPPDRRYYWRSRVFDSYENGRWAPSADTRLTDPEAPLEVTQEEYLPGARVPVQQHFTLGLNASRLVYTAPQPLRVDLSTRTDLRYTCADPVTDNTECEVLAADSSQTMNVSVIRPLEVLRRGDSYTATSLMSDATAGQLRAAGTNYPGWVRNLYLDVSSTTTDRTRQLARDIVAEATAATVYDQAKAIETWLRGNIVYNEQIPSPPRDRDAVDWVLFDLRQGYCNYYATSMITMLRSLGIPSRMAAGFAQGEWDAASQSFIVREKDAHTWVEVYFPGHGWIEFEPTAAQAPLNRVDENPIAQQPTVIPAASPTPTFTPTPTPTPTQEVPADVPPQVNEQSPPTPTPTPSPTPMPTPTATPVIVPTQPPPLTPPPPPRSLTSLLLPAIGLALLGLLLIILVIVILTFIYWWWEWRGMKGLSPIVRAYARLERYLGLLGIRLRADQTPDERRRAIIHDLPAAAPPVTAITSMYVVERYGPRRRPVPGERTQTEIADEAWSRARSRILKRLLRRVFIPWSR